MSFDNIPTGAPGQDVLQVMAANPEPLSPANTVSYDKEVMDNFVKEVKQLRKDYDAVLQRSKALQVPYAAKVPHDCFEAKSESEKRAKESIMWLGMVLKATGASENPYPESYNPENSIVEKTADGLKL